MKTINIPFFENTKDDSKCALACMRMILKYSFPDEYYPYSKLSAMTGCRKGQWVWSHSILIVLARTQFRIVNIELFDYEEFARRGRDYLKSIWPPEYLRGQAKHSKFWCEQRKATRLTNCDMIVHKNRPASMIDVFNLFDKGYLVVCSINPYVLEGVNQYSAHSVLITGLSRYKIFFHDPGLPSVPNNHCSIKAFERAFCSPNYRYARLYGVKKA